MAEVFLEKVTINPTVELPELTWDWEMDSRRGRQNPVHQGPDKRSSDHTGDFPGLACVCLRVSGGGMGSWWPASELGALNVAVHA